MTAGNRRILIVDDDVRLLRFIEQKLPEFGFEPYTASDSGTACRILLEYPDIKLLLCDKHIGIEDGIQIVKRAKEINARIILVGMSGNPEAETEFKANGAVCFFEKPFSIRNLCAMLSEIWIP
jgi:DNA-binding NtrC family response regulator